MLSYRHCGDYFIYVLMPYLCSRHNIVYLSIVLKTKKLEPEMDVYEQHYINGQWVDSLGGISHHVINPATEEPSTKITFGTRADVDAATEAARNALKTFRHTSCLSESSKNIKSVCRIS